MTQFKGDVKQARGGFTLVELLVVITIIGILMGLLIPAVNAARETARRNQCATQLKNLSMAAIQHENTKGQLPGWVQKFGVFAGGTVDPSDPMNFMGMVPRHVKVGTWAVALLPWLDAQPTYEHWTEDRYPIISDGMGTFEETSGESGDGFHKLAAPNLAIMQCPSNPVSVGEDGKNSYVANNGMYDRSASGSAITGVDFEQSMSRENGAFTSKYNIASINPTTREGVPSFKTDNVKLDDFKDGQGNTMLFSENVQAFPWHRAGFINAENIRTADKDIIHNDTATSATGVVNNRSARLSSGMVWHYSDKQNTEPSMATLWTHGAPDPVNLKHNINGGGTESGQDIFTLAMTSSNANDLARPSSAHVDGVNAGMADGGTRFISESIDYRVYQAYMTLRGKSSDVPWREFVLTGEAL